MQVRISLAREWNRSTEEVIRLIGELASHQREFPYPNSRDRVPMHEYYGEPASDDFKVDSRICRVSEMPGDTYSPIRC